MSDETPLTDEEAEALLARLSKHYNQPVMPVQRYCQALETWKRKIQEINRGDRQGQGSSYHEHLTRIWTDIRKSNLLYRLIYLGQQMRTEECPDCQGKWGRLDCPQCGGTGWLPEEKDKLTWPQGVQLVELVFEVKTDAD